MKEGNTQLWPALQRRLKGKGSGPGEGRDPNEKVREVTGALRRKHARSGRAAAATAAPKGQRATAKRSAAKRPTGRKTTPRRTSARTGSKRTRRAAPAGYRRAARDEAMQAELDQRVSSAAELRRQIEAKIERGLAEAPRRRRKARR